MPPRKKAKKVVNKKRTEETKIDDDEKGEKGIIQIEEKKEEVFVDEEVERKLAALRAIREVDIEETITALRALRSYYTEEQLQAPVLEFFKENLPRLTISTKEENGQVELKWSNENINGDLIMENAEDMNYSILRRLSMGFPDLYSKQSLGGYDLPDNMRASLLGTDNTHLENFVFPGAFESQMLTNYDALCTPGQSVSGDQRMSFGMTPKTRRQPKPGEMMLSVHGSPLGVYQEDDENNNNNNMGAINEEDC